MTEIRKLIDGLAEWDGREPSYLADVARKLEEAGLMPAPSGLSWTATANLLIAANLPYLPERPEMGVQIFRSLKREERRSKAPLDPALEQVFTAKTLGDALEAVLTNAPRIREWFVDRRHLSDAVDYIVNRTCAMRVTLKAGRLPRAMIKIQREEGEPAYVVEFRSTDETVALMPDEDPLDRQVEISFGLPTILSLAGAILRKNLIENESQAA